MPYMQTRSRLYRKCCGSAAAGPPGIRAASSEFDDSAKLDSMLNRAWYALSEAGRWIVRMDS